MQHTELLVGIANAARLDDHRALMDDRSMPVHGLGSSLLSTGSAAASDHTSYGFASHAFIDHGLAHDAMALCKA